ncbi:chaperonin 10-like protein [Scheffersomyces amazonensis]|uniref:chaperonin 10-like protein n=1 Tax=Scheffersomyces amazonensis TaxID=1078765 RepID=UPI00315CED31
MLSPIYLDDFIKKHNITSSASSSSSNPVSVPKTQIAYGYVEGEPTIQKFTNYPVPTPKSNEVLLKIEAAGLCMSDPHVLIKGPIVSLNEPPAKKFVMGHEIAGSIASVGDGLKDDPRYQIGSRYALSISVACGTCDTCRTGRDSVCYGNTSAYGLNRDGGFQQYLLIDNLRSLLPIPEGVSYADAAVASDSVLTPYHAIQKIRHLLQPTAKVLVVCLGGLGMNGVQVLKNYGCKIVASDVKAELGPIALASGAHEFYTDVFESDHAQESFDVVMDFVGIQPTSDVCQRFVKLQGKYLTVGLGRSKLFLQNYELARREIDVIFSFGGNSQEQIDCMKWVAAGKIKPLTTIAKLSEVPYYLDQLVQGKVQGRIVFEPNSEENIKAKL